MTAKPSKNEQFSPEETRKRMEAALRGARIAGHKTMSEIAPKKGKLPRNAKRKSKRPTNP